MPDATEPEDLELAEEVVVTRAIPPERAQLLKRLALLAVTAIGLYVIWPGLASVLSAWPKLATLDVRWVGLSIALEAGSVFLGTLLIAEAVGTYDHFFAVGTSQLASNALGRVVPGGAAGGALQYQMLVRSGLDPTRTVTGLATVNLIITAVPFAMPVFALPALFGGGSVERQLKQAAVIGLSAFVVLFVVGVVLIATDRPLRAVAGFAQGARNRIRRKRAPVHDLAERLIRERNLMRHTLGRRWWAALGTAVGRSAFDFAALLAALAAVGTKANPILVLLAYVAASVLALIPITPGGLGFVEAGLVGMLKLAGVAGPDAVLAALTYRLVSFWLPLPVGAVAYGVYLRRFGKPGYGTANASSP